MTQTETEYQVYLFSQLFHLELAESIEDVPYDLLFPIIKNELDKFINSEFNDESETEYECMELYLTCNSDKISLRINDHYNL